MKIDRKKFLEAVEYISVVNHTYSYNNLSANDYSEFFDMESEEFKKRYDDWKFTGLNVRDFILMNEDIWI